MSDKKNTKIIPVIDYEEFTLRLLQLSKEEMHTEEKIHTRIIYRTQITNLYSGKNTVMHILKGYFEFIQASSLLLHTLSENFKQIFKNAKSKEQEPLRPPKKAEKLLYLLLPKKHREEILGDLTEEYYQDIVPIHGAKFAKRWFWSQTIRSIISVSWFAAWEAVNTQYIKKRPSSK